VSLVLLSLPSLSRQGDAIFDSVVAAKSPKLSPRQDVKVLARRRFKNVGPDESEFWVDI
jgi:hypothetical protein